MFETNLMSKKKQSEKTRLKLQLRKEELQKQVELDKLRKENPEQYDKLMMKNGKRNIEEREKQVNELHRKLNGIGIPDYQLTDFLNMGETFIVSGNTVKRELHFDGMLNGAYLEVELNAELDKACSITTKNIRVNENALKEL